MGVLADWQKDKPQTPAFAGGMTATNPNTPAFADAMGGSAAARGVSNLQVKAPPPPPETPATPGAPAAPATPGAPAAPAAPKEHPRAPYFRQQIQNQTRYIFTLQQQLANGFPVESEIASAQSKLQQLQWELSQLSGGG